MNQRLNPHEFIADVLAIQKAKRLAEQTAKLGSEYQPEIKPVTVDLGITRKVANNCFIDCSVNEWENKERASDKRNRKAHHPE